jgi:transposase
LSERKPYPSDLTDEQQRILEPLIPPEKHGGRHRTVDMREILNAILYIRAVNNFPLMPSSI